jgi:hypothetical protein
MQSPTPDLARTETARGPGVAVPSARPRSKLSLAGRILGVVFPLLVIVVLFVVDVPVCPSRGLFGMPCPGCGLTRATFAMLSGDLHGMLHFHPMAPVLAPIFGFTLLRTSAVSAGLIGSSKWDLLAKVPSWIWVVTVVAMLGLFGLRLGGLLGGLPDPVDFGEGLFAQAFARLFG